MHILCDSISKIGCNFQDYHANCALEDIVGRFGNRDEQIQPAWMNELDECDGLYSDAPAQSSEVANTRNEEIAVKRSDSIATPAPKSSFLPKSPYQASKSSVFGMGGGTEYKSFGGQNSFSRQSGNSIENSSAFGHASPTQNRASLFGRNGDFGSASSVQTTRTPAASYLDTPAARSTNINDQHNFRKFAGRPAKAQEFPELDELIARVESKGVDEVIGFSVDDDDDGEMRLPILIRPNVSEGGEHPDVQDEIDAVTALFMKNGLLDRCVDGYEVRRPQMEMVRNVAKAYFNTKNAVIEAGTGTGKTFAYLLPLVRAGAKTVVSTHTKTLQDQLTKRDALKVLQLLNSNDKVVLLKGRSNYLCLRDLTDYFNEQAPDAATSYSMRDMESLLKEVRLNPEKYTGDISNLDDETGKKIKFGVLESIKNKFASKRITCLGKKCEHKENCFFMRARARAKNAQILVVNHSLMLINSLLQSKAQEINILPEGIDTVVFDEAHRLEEVARGVFSSESSPKTANALCDDLTKRIKNKKLLDGIKYPDIIDAGKNLYAFLLEKTSKHAADEKSDTLSLTKKKLLEYTGYDELVSQVDKYVEVLRSIANGLNKSASAIDPPKDSEDSSKLNDKNLLQNISQSFNELASDFVMFATTDNESTAYIADIDIVSPDRGNFVFRRVPIDVSKIFSDKVLAPINSSGNAIFASATLTTNGSFMGYMKDLGLARDTMTASVGSPFEYSERGALYLPPNGVSANMFGKERAEHFIDSFAHLLNVIKGGFLVLCTSISTMNSTYFLLKKYLDNVGSKRNLYVQSGSSKNTIIKNMLAEKNAITVATQSFWEGVDLPGEALECVVIDRLPFKAAKDPFMELQAEYIEKKGGSPFIEVQLPSMIIAMKQGAGRLIRTMTDVGVVVIADDRMQNTGRRSYISTLLCDLPPFEIIYSEDKIVSFYENAKRSAEESAKMRKEIIAASQKKNSSLAVDDADIADEDLSEEKFEFDEESESASVFDRTV